MNKRTQDAISHLLTKYYRMNSSNLFFPQCLTGFIPCTVDRFCKTGQMKVQRAVDHEFTSLICINRYLKAKSKQTVNVVVIIGKNSEVSVALQFRLLIKFF